MWSDAIRISAFTKFCETGDLLDFAKKVLEPGATKSADQII